MFRKTTSLASITQPFPGILLDAYGVFWGGNRLGPLEGATEAMQHLVSQGKIVGILSNSTQQAESEILKIQDHGLIQGIHYHFFLTSGSIAKAFFRQPTLPFATPHQKFWTFGEMNASSRSYQSIFEHSPFQETPHIEEADFIYIMVPQLKGRDQTNAQVFEAAIAKIAPYGLPMVCANPDQFAHEGNPPQAVVRQGSIAQCYEKMGGTVFYIGKPYPLAYQEALKAFRQFNLSNPNDILMIGDTPETDIRGAKKAKMQSALVIESGIVADRLRQNPHYVLPETDTPDFYLRRFSDDL